MSKQTGPILLATDLSARGDRALDRALQLAKERGTQLIVLHVMESHGGTARLTTPSGGACRPITRRWPNANWPRTWRLRASPPKWWWSRATRWPASWKPPTPMAAR